MDRQKSLNKSSNSCSNNNISINQDSNQDSYNNSNNQENNHDNEFSNSSPKCSMQKLDFVSLNDDDRSTISSTASASYGMASEKDYAKENFEKGLFEFLY
jgi:hypothetical protein